MNFAFLRKVLSYALVCGALSSGTAAHADDAFLTLTGNIAHGNDHKLTLSKAEFDALPAHTISTSTNWTKGVHTFTGPLMRDVQRLAGSDSKTVTAISIDDYVQQIPTSDFTKYDVVIATKMDGKSLPLEKYGPMWIIYPRDDFPRELKNPMTDGKLAWQLVRLDFK